MNNVIDLNSSKNNLIRTIKETLGVDTKQAKNLANMYKAISKEILKNSI